MFDGRKVVGVSKGEAHLDRAVEIVIVVSGAVGFLAGDSKTGRDVKIHGGGGPALKKSGGVVERFDG